ncbi:diacylglycerol kinase family protein [Saprospira sp. CCB-QB6]|uniref:diacylglycerol kinase family protein n=1 Tax=Saprospira sp. CCB-QB6 TaxID=3023936 RepID=UPI00234A9ABF|nr:diacylglycerol kinase family protein [Saprospira sp. CCB-QB6]WCL82788.1 diacylglycerol kinase family protein [Saprospira sp. CCB-QB6]
MKNYIKARWASFGYAFAGLFDFVSGRHPHAILHLIAAITVLLAAYYFALAPWEWGLIILAIGGVLALEALNSALEYVVDLVQPDFHPLAKKAKDMAAAAVLIFALATLGLAGLIFWPKILNLLAS